MVIDNLTNEHLGNTCLLCCFDFKFTHFGNKYVTKKYCLQNSYIVYVFVMGSSRNSQESNTYLSDPIGDPLIQHITSQSRIYSA